MTGHTDIRIGTLAGKGAKTPEYIRHLVPMGFESFQINFFNGIPTDVNLAQLAGDVRKVLDQTGNTAVISSLAVFGNPLEESRIADDFAACIDAAELFGESCKVVAGFTGCLTGKPVPDAIKPFGQVWSPLAKRAEDKGLKIAFENCSMGGSWKSASWNIALNPAAWELMFNEVTSEAVGLEWEPCHQMSLLIDPLPQLRQWVQKVYHVHGKDATVYWDVVRAHGISSNKPFIFHRTPGFGDTNWTDVISILRKAGYKGTIDIEGWHDPVYRGELELTGQVHGLKYLKHCRGGDFVPNPAGF